MPEEAYLLTVVNEKNENGFPVTTKRRKHIYVQEKSATRLEFYEAMRSGINVSHTFDVRKEDWELNVKLVDGKKTYPTQIEYDGEVLDIVRTYGADKATVQLICGTGGIPYVR